MMAPSGAGKTTLLRILAGLEKADSGQIEGLEGLRISMVFQEDRLCENLSASANIRLVRGKKPWGRDKKLEAKISRCGSFPAGCGSGQRFYVPFTVSGMCSF